MLQELTVSHSQKRITRIAVSALFFLTGLCFSSWASRIPAIQHKLNLSEGELGGMLLALPIGSILSMPVAGILVSRYGSRYVLMTAGLLYAFILPTLGLTSTAWQLFSCLILFGFCGNLANIAVNTQAVLVEAMYGRSIMASFHGLWSLGGFTGASIGSGMSALGILPYQHFLVIMVLAIIIVAVAIRQVVSHDAPASGEKTPLFAWPDKVLLILGIIAFCSMICEGTMFDWSGVYFRKVIEAPEKTAGLGYTAFMSTMAAFRFVADWLTTRFGFKRMLQISGALTAGGLLIAVLLPYFPTAILGFLLVGAGVSSVVPLVYSAAGRSKTLSPGMALAAVSTIGYLGFLAGPPLIGFVAQATSLRISFSIIALMGTCIAVMSTRAKE
ncbi:MFS transporter [Chitinophaga pinensis]|uniref:Major facilitator superfamily MFS_1 n=1 Tax=Chitinophaga pinensis (strain ATCC 43595 / DSM 2588 / LMG 13176 / NBRC 15968 / NCIMB 11800 / UQM 2034) TaxID=485918 RepID=A0A979G0E4_CHIPD|nr:MFS transporter [Chitinophaga pinensis]ACU58421.1 major facilitator superfamily MFS_1 [Chitinophaga pinensis DSM 2588]